MLVVRSVPRLRQLFYQSISGRRISATTRMISFLQAGRSSFSCRKKKFLQLKKSECNKLNPLILGCARQLVSPLVSDLLIKASLCSYSINYYNKLGFSTPLHLSINLRALSISTRNYKRCPNSRKRLITRFGRKNLRILRAFWRK